MKFIKLVLLLLSLHFSLPVHAMMWSGNDLVEYYKEYEKAETPGQIPENWENVGLYIGFVVGVFSAHEQELDLTINRAPKTFRQTLAIVGKYLKDHPDQWSQDAHDLVYRALMITYGKEPKLGTQKPKNLQRGAQP